MNTNNILQVLSENEIIVYGAGYVAENFYNVLKHNQLEKNIKCFVVSKPTEKKELYGIKVKNVEEITEPNKYMFCIAVHESVLPDIQLILNSKNIVRQIWIYPYILRLALGEPIEKAKLVNVRAILNNQKEKNFFLAIRYLAICDYFGENQVGFDLYQRALYMQCEKNTAIKRVERFKKLICDWEKNGYKDEYPILIDESLRLIDGAHRFSLACYFGIQEISCDIFQISDNYNNYVKESHLMSERMLIQAGFTAREIEFIKTSHLAMIDKVAKDKN